VTLSDPTGAAIGDGQGVGTIANDDDLPGISIGNAEVGEGDSGTTELVFNVTLSNPSDQTVTVDYATGGGSATAGQDYLSATGVLTFAPSVTSQTVTVFVKGDTTYE